MCVLTNSFFTSPQLKNNAFLVTTTFVFLHFSYPPHLRDLNLYPFPFHSTLIRIAELHVVKPNTKHIKTLKVIILSLGDYQHSNWLSVLNDTRTLKRVRLLEVINHKCRRHIFLPCFRIYIPFEFETFKETWFLVFSQMLTD